MFKRMVSILCVLAITLFGGYSLAEAAWTVTSSAASSEQVPKYMEKIPPGSGILPDLGGPFLAHTAFCTDRASHFW